jgi:two-component system sensor histidine kinase PilS (NtrC family)
MNSWKENPESEIKPFRPMADSADLLPRFNSLGQNGGTLILLEDSTEVTQQLQQMKLASLGRLTASIAHEIRNPLGAISHAAQLLEESPTIDKAEHRLTEIIRDHTRRMNSIVENILQLSRREPSHPRKIELKPWLISFLTEFCSMEKIAPSEISLDIFPENTSIYFDSGHLHQVLWNLCKNALKYGKSEQSIKIALRGGITEESHGPFLDIIDSGEGINPETASQIFEPFFTTGSGGTGLGLYITRELCECNKARLSYHPVPTGGSCFRISFYDPIRMNL